MSVLKKFSHMAVLVVLVLASALLLSACGKDVETQDTEPDTTEEESAGSEDENEEDLDESEEDNGDEENIEEEEEEEVVGDFSDFSEDTQTVGDSSDKASAEYTLASISDSQQSGFHRFIFDLSSTETEFASVEAQLVSSGGYIRVKLDRVTQDDSGIIYQGTREINEDGVLKLYHAVTPNESEEVYQVGISQDTTFYLHTDDGLKVVLDVKYPGEVESGDGEEDSMEFTTSATTLSGTNTVGDARFVSYSWSTESTLLKFIWGSSSASGNPTPPTTVAYNASAKTVTVTFTDLQADAVIGSDGTFSSALSTIVDEVTGTRSGTTSTYVFDLNDESRYRIYRSTSPNQVVLDIER